MTKHLLHPLALFVLLLSLASCKPDPELPADATPHPAQSATAPGAPIKVMTFNIRQQFPTDAASGTPLWEDRKDLVVQTITDQQADIVLLQEDFVLAKEFGELGGYGISNGDTTITDTLASDTTEIRPLEYLRNNLPEYTFFGAGARDGMMGGEGEHVSILYLSARFTRLESGHIALSDSFQQAGSITWGNNSPRKATWLRLSDKDALPGENFERFTIMNTHFDAKSDSSEYARLRSAQLLSALIGSQFGDEPLILGGDFNSNEDKAPHSILLSGNPIPLIDGYRAFIPQRSPHEATFHGFTGDSTGSRIDIVYHTGELETVEAEIVRTDFNGAYPSDHFPVLYEIR